MSVAVRWQALQALVEKEKWTVVSGDRKDGTLEALLPSTDSKGIRDRIKIALLSENTVVEVRSEVESAGSWYTTPFCCPRYSYFRERLLAARLDGGQAFDVAVAPEQPTAGFQHHLAKPPSVDTLERVLSELPETARHGEILSG